MSESLDAAIAANRFGLGARPGDLLRIGSDARGWLDAQLAGAPPVLPDPDLRGSAQILSDALEIRDERARARRQAQGVSGATPEQVAKFMRIAELYRPLYLSEARARLAFAAASERSFVERLTQFWSNHFTVSVDKAIVVGLAGAFEREAIRPHVLGKFGDMLRAVEQHPAMLLYLDNYLSVGPNATLARLARLRPKARVGINENLAREILELHTLGVDGGYTQIDVTTFACVISGWSIGGGRGLLSRGEPGRFLFRPGMHEPGAKVLLGKRYPEGGLEQGEAVLHDLARHPATARHIATKLARHFIADDPPSRAVERLTHAFIESDGDLPHLYRVLLNSPEPWRESLPKYKTPIDYVVSVHRGLALPVGDGPRGLAPLEQLGQRTYAPGSPAGWPDRAGDWDGATALLKRVQWADALGQRLADRYDASALAVQLLGASVGSTTRSALAHAASAAQGLTLLLAAPEFLRR